MPHYLLTAASKAKGMERSRLLSRHKHETLCDAAARELPGGAVACKDEYDYLTAFAKKLWGHLGATVLMQKFYYGLLAVYDKTAYGSSEGHGGVSRELMLCRIKWCLLEAEKEYDAYRKQMEEVNG